MAGSKSKRKGNAGELALAKLLSGIFGGSFVRVPNSGSFTGGTNHFRKALLSDTQNRIYRGDIITPDHLSKMVIECKAYAEFQYHSFLSPGTIPILEKWIEQSFVGYEPGDFSFIAFKVDRKFWTVVILEEMIAGMVLKNFATYIDGKNRKFIATELTDFFTTNKDKIAQLCA